MKSEDIDLVLPYFGDAADYSDLSFPEIYSNMRNTFIRMALNEDWFHVEHFTNQKRINHLNDIDILDTAYCDNLYMSLVCMKAFDTEEQIMTALKTVDKHIKPYKSDSWHYYDMRVAAYLSGCLQRLQGDNSAKRTNYFCNQIFGKGEKNIESKKKEFFDLNKLADASFIHLIMQIILFWRMKEFTDKRKEMKATKPDSTRSVNSLEQVQLAYKQFKLDILKMVLNEIDDIISEPNDFVSKLLGEYDHSRINRIADNKRTQVPEELLVSLLLICTLKLFAPALINKIQVIVAV